MLSTDCEKMNTNTLEKTIYEKEEWFTLDDISPSSNEDTLYCISVKSEEKQFLIGENIAVPTHNTEEGKGEDEMKGEASMILSSIARLGRAAGIHMVLATQRPDATILPGETKANLGVRVNCGNTDSNASGMILGNGEGTRVKANPKGRIYLRIYGSGDHGQGFFASPNWIDEYLAAEGKNPDGTPLTVSRSKLAKVTDFSEFDEDLDSREGVDNTNVINKIKKQESEESGFVSDPSDNDSDETDWFLEDDDDDDENSDTENTKEDKSGPGAIDRPDLSSGGGDANKLHRPEEDWDDDLEAMIDENFERD